MSDYILGPFFFALRKWLATTVAYDRPVWLLLLLIRGENGASKMGCQFESESVQKKKGLVTGRVVAACMSYIIRNIYENLL